MTTAKLMSDDELSAVRERWSGNAPFPSLISTAHRDIKSCLAHINALTTTIQQVAGERDTLDHDLQATRGSFSKVVLAVKKARCYANWPEHSGSFDDYVVGEIDQLRTQLATVQGERDRLQVKLGEGGLGG